MAVKCRRTWEYEGFTLSMEPIEDTIKVARAGDGWEVRYLVHDECPENPFESWDGIGRFVHWKGVDASERREYERLRGICPDCEAITERGEEHGPDCDGTALQGLEDAVAIDKYEHGGVLYSVAGEGMQCQWDTSRVWAYWVPDKATLESWPMTEAYKRAGVHAIDDARRAWMVDQARGACKLFNWWANGEVYGVVVERSGEVVDSCFGYYGREEALKARDNKSF